MSDFSQGDGWWVATDGRWYPPHQHPDVQQATTSATLPVWQPPAVQPPTVAPEVQSPTIEPARNGCAVAAIIAAVVLFVIVVGLIVVGLYSAGGSQPDADISAPPTASSTTVAAPSPSTVAPIELDGGVDALLDPGPLTTAAGSRDEPIPLGEVAFVEGGWLVRVNSVDRDAWPELQAENEFNDAPEPGDRFVMANVSATYVGRDEPQVPWAALRVSMVGASAVEQTTSCGVVPDELGGFAEVFSGGTITGNTCIVVGEDDADSVQLGVAADFFTDPLLFELAATEVSPTPMPRDVGPVEGAALTRDRLDPIPVGTEVALGEDWTLEVLGGADRTEDVLAENEFNESPPAGHRYVVVDYLARYAGQDGPASLFDLIFNAVGDSNVSFEGFCGVIPGQTDGFADLYAGATVAGSVCFVVPETDLGTEVVYASVAFGDPVVFAIR